MSSKNRISANRVNSRYSTGPRTDRGKQRSSMNAVKHGLTANTDIIPGDKPYSYKSFRHQLLLELSPQSLIEQILADRIIGASWRLKRIPKLESSIFREMRTKESQPAPALAELAIALANAKKSANRPDMDDVAQAQGGEPSRPSPVSSQGAEPSRSRSSTSRRSTGWLEHSEHFARFVRYESALERSLFRCLKEFRETKSLPSRTAQPTSAPEDMKASPHQLAAEGREAPSAGRRAISPASQSTATVGTGPVAQPESTAFPTELSRPPHAPVNSPNPFCPNHFHHSLYYSGLASFRNPASARTAPPTSTLTPGSALHECPCRLGCSATQADLTQRSDRWVWAYGPVASFGRTTSPLSNSLDHTASVGKVERCWIPKSLTGRG